MGNIKKIYLGVDWGTHSSKWATDIITEDGRNITKSNIIKSDLLSRTNEIIIDPSDDDYPDIERAGSLKRKIINDPYGAF